MKKILLIACLLCGSLLPAQRVLISFKVIVNPETGIAPNYSAGLGDIVRDMNEIISQSGRAIEFVIGEIRYIGGAGNQLVGQFYDADPLGHDADLLDVLEHTARSHPQSFYWRDNAINYYINNIGRGGQCSFPSSRRVILSGFYSEYADHYLHEIGHFFNLCHTHGCNAGSLACNELDHFAGRDDGLDDTLLDSPCWEDEDEMAIANYGRRYNELLEYQQEATRLAFSNVMSYHRHGSRAYLTSDQLDRFVMAMFNHENRRWVTDGLPIYTTWSGGCEGIGPFQLLDCGYCEASPENHVQGLECAIEVSKTQPNRNRIVLVPWIYRTGPITINTPVIITTEGLGEFSYSEIK